MSPPPLSQEACPSPRARRWPAPGRLLKRGLHRWVLSRRWLSFLVMGLAFLLFGLGSLNLIHLLAANLALLNEHGWQAWEDGGLRQLLELLLSGYGSLLAYLVFKTCEHVLVHAWSAPD